MPLLGSRGGGSAKGFGLTAAISVATWVSAPAVSGVTFTSWSVAGGKSSAILSGGFDGDNNLTKAQAARFNGTSWSSIPNMPYDTFQHGIAGDGSSAIAYGGAVRPPQGVQSASASWNGTAWSSPPATPVAQREIDGRNGSAPALFSVGGNPNGDGASATNVSYKYNGTSFSTSPNYPLTIRGNGVSGDSSNAISYGGNNASGTNYSNAYRFNGSAWSSIPSLSATRQRVVNGFGPASDAMSVGGNDGGTPGALDIVESFNGTTWATAESIPVATTYITTGSSAAGSFTDGGAYLITNGNNPTFFWTK